MYKIESRLQFKKKNQGNNLVYYHTWFLLTYVGSRPFFQYSLNMWVGRPVCGGVWVCVCEIWTENDNHFFLSAGLDLHIRVHSSSCSRQPAKLNNI